MSTKKWTSTLSFYLKKKVSKEKEIRSSAAKGLLGVTLIHEGRLTPESMLAFYHKPAPHLPCTLRYAFNINWQMGWARMNRPESWSIGRGRLWGLVLHVISIDMFYGWTTVLLCGFICNDMCIILYI
jgi:hypothetical protein